MTNKEFDDLLKEAASNTDKIFEIIEELKNLPPEKLKDVLGSDEWKAIAGNQIDKLKEELDKLDDNLNK
jgi:hypothetical protein